MSAGPPLRLPDPCLVVLVGATAAGKSHWAQTWFQPDQVVSSDRLRGVVGAGERDLRASRDAFEVLDLIVAKRLGRRLTTVVDSTGLDAKRRAAWRAQAERAGVPAHAVVFARRRRHRARAQPRPRRAGPRQGGGRPAAAGRGGGRRARRRGLRGRPPRRTGHARPTRLPHRPRRRRPPAGGSRCRSTSACRSRASTSPATRRPPRARSRTMAVAAEEAGFTSLWVMDHFLQIPQVGREWQDMLESYTTLAYLAGLTRGIRLGTLVTGIGYRNLAHVAKLVATLDVLSGGRALCGLGAGWFEREQRAYGWEPLPRRRALRAAGGRARAAAADVGPGIAALRGPHGHRGGGDLLSAPAAGAHSDPRRGRGRAADAAARRAARRRLQPASATRRPCGTRSPCCASTAPPKGAIRRRSA